MQLWQPVSRNWRRAVISSHIRVCLWSCCFLTMTCFGVPFPSVCGLQDKQLGNVLYICHSESNVFSGTLFMDIDLLNAALHLHALLPVTCSSAQPSHLLGDCFHRQGQGSHDKKGASASPNIIKELILLCMLLDCQYYFSSADF